MHNGIAFLGSFCFTLFKACLLSSLEGVWMSLLDEEPIMLLPAAAAATTAVSNDIVLTVIQIPCMSL